MQNSQQTSGSAFAKPETSNGGDAMMESVMDQAQWFTQMWTDFAVKMAAATANVNPTTPPPDAARQARTAVFQAMSQTADEYMRMPQFLQMAKQSMELTTTFRKHMNDFLTAMHHNTQGIAKQDIDQLMLSVRHLETRVLDGLEQIGSRIDAMSKRIASLEEAGRASAAEPAMSGAAEVEAASGANDDVVARAAKRPPKRPREEGAKN